jgi:hypothetical protein
MFEPRVDSPEGVDRLGEMTYLTGKYWERGEPGPFRNVRSFPSRLYKGGEVRFSIKGRKNFTEPYQGFDVEVIGLDFPFRPMQSAGPGFHQRITYKSGTRRIDKVREVEKVRSYNACRITHRETGVVADAHAWESHGLLVTVKQLPKNPTGPAIKAASTLLVFFSVEYRGAPKITRDFIMDTFEKLGRDATQAAVARELGTTERALQLWAEREGIKGWEGMRESFAPRPELVEAN